MAKCKELRLTHQELLYLLDLAIKNVESGDYIGRMDYYYKRQGRVMAKLNQAKNTKLA